MKTPWSLAVLGVAIFVSVPGLCLAQTSVDIEKMKQQLDEIQRMQQVEAANLKNFDDLDFNVYSGQKWDQLGKSHAKEIRALSQWEHHQRVGAPHRSPQTLVRVRTRSQDCRSSDPHRVRQLDRGDGHHDGRGVAILG